MNKLRSLAAGLVVSLSGLLFIQGYEGSEPVAYVDPVGIPTVCSGHTKGVLIGQRRTPAECESFLIEDTSEAGRAISRLVTVPLTQRQYDALVSFTFNVGAGNLARSTLLRKLNQGLCTQAASEFKRWDYAKGTRLRGLTKRRAAEAAMFKEDCDGS